MVDTLHGIGPGTIVIAGDVHFKVYKLDSKPQTKVYVKQARDGKVYFSEQRYANPLDGRLATFTVQEVTAKTVPCTWSGPATSDDCTYHGMALMLTGDRDVYEAWLASRKRTDWFGGMVGMECAMASVDPDAPRPLVDTKRFKKLDLICAVLMAYGPLHKDDVLRRVAVLEGKPWVRGSNSDYFTVAKQHMGCIEPCGKDGAKVTHYLTSAGVIRGSQVLAAIGVDLVQSIA